MQITGLWCRSQACDNKVNTVQTKSVKSYWTTNVVVKAQREEWITLFVTLKFKDISMTFHERHICYDLPSEQVHVLI